MAQHGTQDKKPVAKDPPKAKQQAKCHLLCDPSDRADVDVACKNATQSRARCNFVKIQFTTAGNQRTVLHHNNIKYRGMSSISKQNAFQ